VINRVITWRFSDASASLADCQFADFLIGHVPMDYPQNACGGVECRRSLPPNEVAGDLQNRSDTSNLVSAVR
jgi:hypothetical protein